MRNEGEVRRATFEEQGPEHAPATGTGSRDPVEPAGGAGRRPEAAAFLRARERGRTEAAVAAGPAPSAALVRAPAGMP
jgi:hypothetical protein